MEGYPPLDDDMRGPEEGPRLPPGGYRGPARKLNHRQAGGMACWAWPPSSCPCPSEVWRDVIVQRFEGQRARVAEKNLEAFGGARPRPGSSGSLR